VGRRDQPLGNCVEQWAGMGACVGYLRGGVGWSGVGLGEEEPIRGAHVERKRAHRHEIEDGRRTMACVRRRPSAVAFRLASKSDTFFCCLVTMRWRWLRTVRTLPLCCVL
jgi:hypothetical protein